jgi:hypothetical protein
MCFTKRAESSWTTYARSKEAHRHQVVGSSVSSPARRESSCSSIQRRLCSLRVVELTPWLMCEYRRFAHVHACEAIRTPLTRCSSRRRPHVPLQPHKFSCRVQVTVTLAAACCSLPITDVSGSADSHTFCRPSTPLASILTQVDLSLVYLWMCLQSADRSTDIVRCHPGSLRLEILRSVSQAICPCVYHCL